MKLWVIFQPKNPISVAVAVVISIINSISIIIIKMLLILTIIIIIINIAIIITLQKKNINIFFYLLSLAPFQFTWAGSCEYWQAPFPGINFAELRSYHQSHRLAKVKDAQFPQVDLLTCYSSSFLRI